MSAMNPKVDAYLGRATNWRVEMEKLRSIALDCGLIEELKWGKPCYLLQGANVVLIVAFKEWCALLFTKGALLRDPNGILVQPTENTQAARQMRFTSLEQIDVIEADVKSYILNAIEVEESGQEVTFKKIDEFKVPEELQERLDAIPNLKTAFQALTPGRQRAYYMHFAEPKQEKTRVARIEKCIPQILSGKGLNDR